MRKQITCNTLLAFITAIFLLSTNLGVSATHATAESDKYVVDEIVTKSFDDIPSKLAGKTVILQTNDVHGIVWGYAYVASLKHILQNYGAEVILVDCGDFSSEKKGTPRYVSSSNGFAAINIMNEAEYDIVTFGNHEFEKGGIQQFSSNLNSAKFKTINASFKEPDGETFTDPNYIYKTKSGLNIGFFGLSTPEVNLFARSNRYINLYNSGSGNALNKCAEEQVDFLKDKSDIIICLAHLGVNQDRDTLVNNRSIDVYKNVPGIDLILDGHSHTAMTSGNDNEPILSTGKQFANIGVVIIDDKTKTIEDKFLIPQREFMKLVKDEKTDSVARSIVSKTLDETDN